MMGLNVSTSRGRYSVAQFGCAIRSMFTLQQLVHVHIFCITSRLFLQYRTCVLKYLLASGMLCRDVPAKRVTRHSNDDLQSLNLKRILDRVPEYTRQ